MLLVTKIKIKNILCEIQNTSPEKVIEDIKNIINNNKLTITRKTLIYLNVNLEKFIVNKTSKLDNEILVQVDNNSNDESVLSGLTEDIEEVSVM